MPIPITLLHPVLIRVVSAIRSIVCPRVDSAECVARYRDGGNDAKRRSQVSVVACVYVLARTPCV